MKMYCKQRLLIALAAVLFAALYAQHSCAQDALRREVVVEEAGLKPTPPKGAIPERPKPGIEKPPVKIRELPEGADKEFSVKEVIVKGSTKIPPERLDSLTESFKNTRTTIRKLYGLADQITALYQDAGYLTSRAIIPPQDLDNGIVIIEAVEGIFGQARIMDGGKYFSDLLIDKRLKNLIGKVLNFWALNDALNALNENPDRKVKATFTAGETPRTTDLLLHVDERYPVHAGFDFDNQGTKYTSPNRFAVNMRNNNLSGSEDTLILRYQFSERSRYQGFLASYIMNLDPLNRIKLGIDSTYSTSKLGREFAQINVNGDACNLSLYTIFKLYSKDNFVVSYTLAFDSKEARTNIGSDRVFRDSDRVLRTNVSITEYDGTGAVSLLGQFEWGIPDIFGGTGSVNSKSSNGQTGCDFKKYTVSATRAQQLPLDALLLATASGQITGNQLNTLEQFYIGGYNSVRGFTEGEFLGDVGVNSVFELRTPLYGLPRSIRFKDFTLYDCMRIVYFYDIGYTTAYTESNGRDKSVSISGIGFGGRLDFTDRLSASFDVAWSAIGNRHSETSEQSQPLYYFKIRSTY